MTDTRREVVLKAFATVLQAVATAEATATGFFRDPPFAIDEDGDGLPCILMMDGDERRADLESGLDSYELEVEVYPVVLRPATGTIGETFSNLAAAIVKAILADPTLGAVAGVENTTYEGAEALTVVAEEGATAFAFAALTFQVTYSTAANNPLSPP